jgi:hypothetical protein
VVSSKDVESWFKISDLIIDTELLLVIKFPLKGACVTLQNFPPSCRMEPEDCPVGKIEPIEISISLEKETLCSMRNYNSWSYGLWLKPLQWFFL